MVEIFFDFLKKEYENMTCSEKARTQHSVPGAGEEKKEKRRECRDKETVESGYGNTNKRKDSSLGPKRGVRHPASMMEGWSRIDLATKQT